MALSIQDRMQMLVYLEEITRTAYYEAKKSKRVIESPRRSNGFVVAVGSGKEMRKYELYLSLQGKFFMGELAMHYSPHDFFNRDFDVLRVKYTAVFKPLKEQVSATA